MRKHNFKKILALLIALIMVIPAIPVVASADTNYVTPEANTTKWPTVDDWLNDVKNSSTGYYEIDSKEDLTYFMFLGSYTGSSATTTDEFGRSKTSTRFNGKTFVLTQDIYWNEGTATATGFVPDVAGTAINKWTPYWQGTASSSTDAQYYGFRGTFDGQGHTIYGLVMDSESTALTTAYAQGFFKKVGNGAKIQNIYFKDMYVKGTRYVSSLIALPLGKDGTITINNVGVEAFVVGSNTAVGGLIARPDYAATNATIKISNTTFSGYVKGTSMVGGFIGNHGSHSVEITNCVSYAEMDIGDQSAGFIGTVSNNVTMTNCTFLGKGDFKNSSGLRGSLIVLADMNISNAYASTASEPATKHSVTLKDCYSLYDTSGEYEVAANNKTPWYDLTIEYTGKDPVTIKPYEIDVSGEQYNNPKNVLIAEAASDNIKDFAANFTASDVVSVIGVQMGTSNNARFVASITPTDTVTTETITEVGFTYIKLDKYIPQVPYMKNHQNQVGDVEKTIKCGSVYKALSSQYSLDEVTAPDGGYLAALAVTGISATTAETMLVRAYYIDAEGTTHYSNYMAATFVNGMLVGCAYVVG